MARHIPVGNICDGCGDHSESVMHALWLCDQVRSVWMTDPDFLFLVQANAGRFWSCWRFCLVMVHVIVLRFLLLWRGVGGSSVTG